MDINIDNISKENKKEFLKALDIECIKRTGKPVVNSVTEDYWLAYYSKMTITEIIDYLIKYMGAKEISK
jgi:UDP-N-acetyl-D-mannosaminuronic acid transferase (WecB/TagA/CpsF family)